jgi:hypothetical protein
MQEVRKPLKASFIKCSMNLVQEQLALFTVGAHCDLSAEENLKEGRESLLKRRM